MRLPGTVTKRPTEELARFSTLEGGRGGKRVGGWVGRGEGRRVMMMVGLAGLQRPREGAKALLADMQAHRHALEALIQEDRQ